MRDLFRKGLDNANTMRFIEMTFKLVWEVLVNLNCMKAHKTQENMFFPCTSVTSTWALCFSVFPTLLTCNLLLAHLEDLLGRFHNHSH